MNEMIEVLKQNVPLSTSLVFVFGLLIGSFLNVCIVRFPKEQSVVGGRSKCPNCEHLIAGYDNIPLISFILLKGKCRNCQKPISWRYPLVEFLTAVSFVVFYLCFGPTVQFVFFTYLMASLLVVTFVDFVHQIIPDEISLHGILFGLLMSYFFPILQGETDKRLALSDSCLGMLVGIGVIYAIAIFGEIVFRKESMGGGDLKLLAMIGTFLGHEKTLLTFFIAPLIATPIGLVMRWVKKTDVIAFGPYLSLAALIALFWGDRLIDRFFNPF